VRSSFGDERVETGLLKLGALIADHAKTAIGTLLPAGCTVGVGANLFGRQLVVPEVPRFAWGLGEDASRWDFGKFLDTARRMKARRGQNLSDAEIRVLASLYGSADSEGSGNRLADRRREG